MGSHRKERLHKQPDATRQLSKHRNDIMGLRALAIVMVVSMHVGLIDIHGGVDVSFVISGFLNTFILMGEFDRSGTIDIRGFLARRFRRLVPGAVIVIALTLLVVWKYAPLQFKSVATDGSLAAVGGLNWRLVEEGTDYFAAANSQTPLQHFWSLGIEEQFYLLMPVALLALAWIGRRLFGNSRAITAVFVAAVVGWSLYECIQLTFINQPLAYFATHTRVWELGLGVFLALCINILSRMNAVLAAVLSWAGLAIIVGTGLLITEETPLPGYAVLGPVLGTCMVVAGGCAAPKFGPAKLLSHWSVKVVADNSYALYLTHWPVLLLWEPVVGYHVTTVGDKLRVIAVSFILAVLIYYPIMKRLQHSQKLIHRPHFNLVGFGGLTTSASAVALAAALWVTPSIPTASAANNQSAGAGTVQEAVKAEKLPSNVQPALVKAPEDEINYGCIDSLRETAFSVRAGCVLGAKTAARTVVLFGDSHAWHWGDAFNKVGLDLNTRVVMVAKEGCSAGAYAIKNPQLKREYTECTAWRTSALDYIANLHPDTVVVSSHIRETATKEGIESTFASLRATGAKLVYMTDTPRPKSNVPNCLVSHVDNINDCAWSTDKAVVFPDQRAIELAAARKYNAKIVDVVPEFCAKGMCPVVIDGKIVFFDDSHLTAAFSEGMASWLKPKIKAAL